METVVPDGEIKEVVGDKGYHSNQVMVDLEAVGVRSYISEPDRGRRNWKDHPEARDDGYRNLRRIRGARGKRLLRKRGERLERPCAHLYETGRMRRHLRGHDNIRERLPVHAGGLNLGLLMRTLFGVGTPRGLQGRAAALFAALWSLLWHPATAFTLIWSRHESPIVLIDLQRPRNVRGITVTLKNAFATGCWFRARSELSDQVARGPYRVICDVRHDWRGAKCTG